MQLDNIQEERPEGIAPYFTEYVRRILEKEDERLGVNIYRDGLKIYTTLDSRLQEIAETQIQRSVVENQKIFNQYIFNNEEEFSRLGYLGIYPQDTVKMMMEGELPLYKELRSGLLVQCGFVALDPTTGEILAMIGGRLIITISLTGQFRRNGNRVRCLSPSYLQLPSITDIL